MSESTKPVIGISVGDLNGIGVEVILKTFANSTMLDFCTPVLFASGKVISYHKKALGMEQVNFQSVPDMTKIVPQKLNLLNCWKEEVKLQLGEESKEVGTYAYRSLDAACEQLEKGTIQALVTAPINKSTIHGEQFPFSGHTDYLENRFEGRTTMMMISEEMRMALATVHIPLKEVARHLTTEHIEQKLREISESLSRDFHITKAKIAVLAVNPHGGDQGLIGDEDQKIIAPAIEKSLSRGIMAFGPYAADSFFGSGQHRKFDAILAMYHDQGLIAFKSLSFGKGVNYTAGLNIIRTSPDHGTGFDIAGQGVANESSFREAVLLACDLVKNRRLTLELTRAPLKINRGNKDH